MASLAELLDGMAPAHAESLVRAFSTYFQVVNIAERVHRIRRRRDYQRADTGRPQPESLHEALRKLKEKGVSPDELRDWLERVDIEPVFTAHPTEAVRRALLEKEQIMVAALVDDLDGGRTPGERAADIARFRMALTSALADRRFLAGAPGRGGRARARRLLPDRSAVPGDAGVLRDPGACDRRAVRHRHRPAAAAALRHVGRRRHGRQSECRCDHHPQHAGRAAPRDPRQVPRRAAAADPAADPVHQRGRGRPAGAGPGRALPRVAAAGRRRRPSAPCRHAVPAADRPDGRAPAGHARGSCRRL